VTCALVAAPAGNAPEISTRQIPLEYFGTKDGLSQGLISAMAQDSDGYIWIGTKDGLNRYDGYTFKIYHHQLGDSSSVANYITSLYVDEANRLWVGTESQGVYLFDRPRETFIHMEHSPRVSGSLRGQSIGYNIWGDRQGHVMVAMNGVQGVDVITTTPPTAGGEETYAISNIDKVYPGLVLSSVPGFFDANFSFWTTGGPWFYRGDSTVYFPNHSLRDGKYIAIAASGGNSCHGMWFMITDPQQEHVYLPKDNDLYMFDAAEGKFRSILKLPQGYTFGCRSVMDHEGRIWTTQSDNSFLRINPKTAAIEHLKPIALASVIEQVASAGTMLVDRYDNIWMGNPGMGIMKISASADLFKQMPGPIPHPSIWPYRISKPGIKADLDVESFRIWQTLSSRLPLAHETQVVSDASAILASDANGAFWLASASSKYLHLIKAYPAKKIFEEISSFHGNGQNWQYLPIIPDRRAGIWYSERAVADSAHLYHIRTSDHAIEVYTFPVKNEIGTNRFLSDWYEEENGSFWFATRMGVFYFNPDTKQWKRYANVPGEKASLSFDKVLSICPDPAEPVRYMWVGTEGGGLNKLDRSTGNCTAYTVEDGLPNNVIYAVQSDKHNNLWMSTNNGLCLFNPRTLEVRNFSASDGLPGNEFNRFQFSKSSTGILCFGGVEGSVCFDPEDFYKKIPDAKVVFTQLRLFNKPVTRNGISGMPDSYKLQSPIEYSKDLVFPYDQHMISFDFALMDLSNPARNRYRYKLEGLNEDWIDNGYNHEVTLTNLAPGDYTLRVSGQNGNGIWTTQEAVMHITILHPWWSTWWFQSAVALMFFALLYALYRYRLQQAVHIERVRNRIAQDLHDEIGSTLSSISLYSAVMKNISPDMPPANRSILDKITQSTSQMMESMNDIVWTIKADNDSFEQVVDRMRAFAVSMTEARDIVLHFDADAVAEKLKMNMDQRKNIYLIFKEAVNNAVKYAACKNLYIHISVNKNKLEVSIVDDGLGFELGAKENAQLGGNGMKGMQTRAKDIGGILSVESTKGKGTTIVLTVPV
jgi:signal transduction histidine kinase/ligand-binding sensor domain-containing protein